MVETPIFLPRPVHLAKKSSFTLDSTMKLLVCAAAFILGCLPGVSSQSTKIPVVGALVSNGKSAVPYRLNINDLVSQGGPAWDLYIQSLRSLYNTDDDDLQSFFQVAGIHGLPFIGWGPEGAENATGWPGHCPHNEKLFATWHRPYTLLYEVRQR